MSSKLLLELVFEKANKIVFTLAEDLVAELSVDDLAVPSFLASLTGPEAPRNSVSKRDV